MSENRPKFEEILRQSRRDRPPSIDVVDKIEDRLQARIPSCSENWSLWGAAGLSITAAAAVFLLALHQDVLLDDPLANWLRPLVMVMQ